MIGPDICEMTNGQTDKLQIIVRFLLQLEIFHYITLIICMYFLDLVLYTKMKKGVARWNPAHDSHRVKLCIRMYILSFFYLCVCGFAV